MSERAIKGCGADIISYWVSGVTSVVVLLIGIRSACRMRRLLSCYLSTKKISVMRKVV